MGGGHVGLRDYEFYVMHTHGENGRPDGLMDGRSIQLSLVYSLYTTHFTNISVPMKHYFGVCTFSILTIWGERNQAKVHAHHEHVWLARNSGAKFRERQHDPLYTITNKKITTRQRFITLHIPPARNQQQFIDFNLFILFIPNLISCPNSSGKEKCLDQVFIRISYYIDICLDVYAWMYVYGRRNLANNKIRYHVYVCTANEIVPVKMKRALCSHVPGKRIWIE